MMWGAIASAAILAIVAIVILRAIRGHPRGGSGSGNRNGWGQDGGGSSSRHDDGGWSDGGGNDGGGGAD